MSQGLHIPKWICAGRTSSYWMYPLYSKYCSYCARTWQQINSHAWCIYVCMYDIVCMQYTGTYIYTTVYYDAYCIYSWAFNIWPSPFYFTTAYTHAECTYTYVHMYTYVPVHAPVSLWKLWSCICCMYTITDINESAFYICHIVTSFIHTTLYSKPGQSLRPYGAHKLNSQMSNSAKLAMAS